MRIAIDCRTLLTRKTGDRTYMMNLVRQLPQVAPQHEYFLLFDRHPEDCAEAPSWLFTVPARLYTLRSSHPRLWTALSLPRFARSEKIDLMHVQYIIPPVRPCPVVSTIHDLSFFRYPQTFPLKDRMLLRMLIPYSARRASLVITGSQSTRRDLCDLCGIPAERVAVTPYGIDEAFAPVRDAHVIASLCARFGLPQSYLLYLGVLQPRKNLVRLLQAYASLRRAKDSVPDLVIAGKRGWMEKEIFAAVKGLGLEQWVHFLDYVPDDTLPVLYSAARVFVCPSLYEGFGLPVLEAMACGTPVVTSNVSSLPEVAGDAAILVDPLDVESINEGMQRALNLSADEREDMVQRGLMQARAHTWKRTAQLTAQVYQSFANREV